MHAPAAHTPLMVQLSPSSHEAPSAAVQPAASTGRHAGQTSTVGTQLLGNIACLFDEARVRNNHRLAAIGDLVAIQGAVQPVVWAGRLPAEGHPSTSSSALGRPLDPSPPLQGWSFRRSTSSIKLPPIPAKFVEQCRVEAVRNGLEAGGEDLSVLARRLGFASVEVMRWAFKRHFAVAPETYRQRFERPASRARSTGQSRARPRSDTRPRLGEP